MYYVMLLIAAIIVYGMITLDEFNRKNKAD